jgi:ABC-type nitrate/sulfonate/bicarbonate transport system permease component
MAVVRHLHIYRNRWHLAAAFFFILLPLAYLFFLTRITHVPAEGLMTGMAVSLGRMIIAYILAAGLGWLFAVSFYRGRRSAIALPIFDILQSVPTFAALPLAVMVLGPTNVTVILFLVLAIIWPIFFSVVSSLKLIRPDWQDAAAIAGLSGWNYVRLFLWPVSFSGLVTGTIVGLGDGWEALIVTEIIVRVRTGAGVFFGAHADSPRLTLLGMLGLLLVIFTINKLIWLPLLDRSHRQLED